MCLLGLAFWQFEDVPLLVLANREEFYARPSSGPQFFPRRGDAPAWVGGIDLVAGGTWLGVNEFGLVVAVTNRAKQNGPANAPSRGLLCRSLLAHRETASCVSAALQKLHGNAYAGCNLLIADCNGAVVIEAGDMLTSTHLDPGLHLIANADLDPTDDRRISRVRNEFQRADPATVEDWLLQARRICQLSNNGGEPPICLVGADRGTVSSAVLGIGRNLEASQFWFAPGPPASTHYKDYTPLLRQLFAIGQTLSDAQSRPFQPPPDIEPPDDSPARRAARQSAPYGIGEHSPAAATFRDADSSSPYRILLRGPWQCEPLARAELGADGKIDWSTSALPSAGGVRLPASWQNLFGAFRGRVIFRRRFHPPSNITSDDRLSLVFDSIGGAATISLNGRSLGTATTTTLPARFDVTGLLRTNNEVVVELVFADFEASAPPGGLYAPIALEIAPAAQ